MMTGDSLFRGLAFDCIVLHNNSMKLWWIGVLLVLVGCGGEVFTGRGPIEAILSGTETPSFGVSVRGWNVDPDGDDEKCLDNGGTSWCSADTSVVKKSVRFTAAGSTQFDTIYLYIRNNQSAEGTIHLKVAI